VIAAACLLVAVFYAGGYVYAAVRRGGPWLDGLRQVNLAAALLSLAVALSLFTPLADPARISVASQVARLASGATATDKFDYGFLRFRGARYGMEALQALAAHGAGPQAAAVRLRAASVLKQSYEDRGEAGIAGPADIAANLSVWPQGVRMPPGFLAQDWAAIRYPAWAPGCLRRPGSRCDAVLLDADGDGRQDVLLIGENRADGSALLAEREGRWQVIGRPPKSLAGCAGLQQRLRAGEFSLAAPRLRDLEAGGQRIVLAPVESIEPDCAQAGSASR